MMKQSAKQFRNVHPMRSSGKLLREEAWGKEGGGNPPAPAASAGLAAWHGTARHSTATRHPLGHLAMASRQQPPRRGQHQGRGQWDLPQQGELSRDRAKWHRFPSTTVPAPLAGSQCHQACPRCPPGPKGRGMARATCSHGTPVISSPSPSLAAGCPFIPCQRRVAALPVSVPSRPSPTASAATLMDISRTGPAIPGCCRGRTFPSPRGLPPWGFPSLAPFPQLFAAQQEGSHPGRAGTAP